MTSATPGDVLVIALLSSTLASCGGNPSAPTEPSSPGGPTMTLRGRIVDDLGNPVQSVTVTLHPEYAASPRAPQQVFTDAGGTFAMAATVRPDRGADGARILVERAGFDGTELWLPASSNVTVTMYPRIVLSSFSTVEARILENAPYTCGDKSYRCRRIQLLPANRALEVTIVASAGEQVGLADNLPTSAPVEYARTVTAADGDVFIIGGPASVTVQAGYPGPADALAGQYSLTLVHDCEAVPEEARTRRYTAAIEPDITGFIVTLNDAQFLSNSACTTMATPILGCNQFLASREADHVRFDLVNGEWHGGYITERVSAQTWLVIYGSAVGRLDGGNVTAKGMGGVWYCPGNPDHPFPCTNARSCEDVNLRLTFVRR
jgi:hypothetical protein